MTVFPFPDYWWLYAAATGLIVALLWMDLILHRSERTMTIKAASLWTAVWIGLSLAFCLGLYFLTSALYSPTTGRQLSTEFLAGYILEESLSVDNMFVFALIFQYFSVPARFQHRVLFYGVLGAIVFRGIFIAAGSVLVRFEWVLIVFGVFLIVSGVRLVSERDRHFDPENSRVLLALRRVVPVTTGAHGSSFLVRIDGRMHATSLLVVLVLLETTDIVFATDSVPAVFGVTREPFVVYTSNIFAILGLRAMFFMLAGAIERFHYLRWGLAVVLIFVGLKMVVLDHLSEGKFPVELSLAVIGAILGLSIALSLIFPKPAADRDDR